VIVRQALPGDVPALAGVAAASYAKAFRDLLSPRALAERRPEFFVARFRDLWPAIRVLEDGGAIIGFSMVSQPGDAPPGHLHLDMLFLAPGRGRRGGGALLLADAETQGARSLECFAGNRPARDFYERHGWRETAAYRREFAGETPDFVRYEKPPATA
jgi:putative acetyltransferase